MVELFHGSLSSEAPKGALTFWGRFRAAVERAEGLFMNHGYWRAYKNGNFLLVDPTTQQILGRESPDQTLKKFATFMNTVSLNSYELDISHSLRLVDCWEDDPIGSGAMKIFNESSGLKQQKLDEIRALFSPYEDIIYPESVFSLSSFQDIERMWNEGQKDAVFCNELEKRKSRSESLGIPFEYAVNQEIVWVSLTAKLRTWALENGYDSFVYEGKHEGKSQDGYVTLKDDQVIGQKKKLQFDTDTFIKDVVSEFSNFLKSKSPSEISTNCYWAGNEPTKYWI